MSIPTPAAYVFICGMWQGWGSDYVCVEQGLSLYQYRGTTSIPIRVEFAYALLHGPKDRIIRRREEDKQRREWEDGMGIAMMPISDQAAYYQAQRRERLAYWLQPCGCRIYHDGTGLIVDAERNCSSHKAEWRNAMDRVMADMDARLCKRIEATLAQQGYPGHRR